MEIENSCYKEIKIPLEGHLPTSHVPTTFRVVLGF